MRGQRFGSLLVIEPVPDEAKLWFCKCDCGVECIASEERLISGQAKSCGWVSSGRSLAPCYLATLTATEPSDTQA